MNASVVAGVEGAVARRIAADEGREYILQVCCHQPTCCIACPCTIMPAYASLYLPRGSFGLWWQP